MNCNTCSRDILDEEIGIKLVKGYICNICFDYKCKFCKDNISKKHKYNETQKDFINVCEACKFLRRDYHILK